jgi:GNAT superfamily N-acetyltransferase
MTGEPARGVLRQVITYLEMAGRPTRPPRHAPPGKWALLRAEQPTLSFYRYLYDTVGENWLWTDRRLMDQELLRAHILDERTELYVLYASGVPAGLFELFRETPATTDLGLFGLIPEFIGRRLSGFLLDAAIDTAWSAEIRKLTVNTCTFDHPRALQMYQKAGFTPVRQETRLKADPRLSGLYPRNAAPHVPIAANED